MAINYKGRASATQESVLKEQAIDYARGGACFRSGEIRSLGSNGIVGRKISLWIN